MSEPDPQVWQVAIQAKQGEPEQAPIEPSVEAIPPAWVDAAENVRTTVKWMVTAFAAIGAVLFAQGFVSTPELSWEDDAWQLGLAWAVGAGGLLAIGWLIYQATALLRPTLYELGTLPDDYKHVLNAEPRFYLPSDVSTFPEFLARFEALRTQEKVWRTKMTQAELTQAKAEAKDPQVDDEVAAATLEVVRARRTHDSLVGALGVYNATRKDILDRAGFWTVSRGLDTSKIWIASAAVLAAVGGVGYVLLLAAPGESEDDGEESGDGAAAAPRIATLTKTATAAGDDLWGMLDLADCQADPGDNANPAIQVIVSSGKGMPDNPYTVTTVPPKESTCHAITFSVINEVATVSDPVKTEITYAPSPSPSATMQLSVPAIP